MQGLAHNLPIRRMDVKDGLIEGGTEEAGGDDGRGVDILTVFDKPQVHLSTLASDIRFLWRAW